MHSWRLKCPRCSAEIPTMWTKRLTKEQQDLVLKDYVEGVPVSTIAERFNIHHTYPSLLARRRGKPTRMNKENTRYAPRQAAVTSA